MMRRLSKIAHDEQGQAETVTWILAQIPFWLLIAILVAVTMLGLRRASAVLATHNAGLAAARVDAEAGRSLAERVLSVWWGETTTVAVTENGLLRSVQAQLDAQWDTVASRIIGSLSIRASSFQRKEEFFAGPPQEDGFE